LVFARANCARNGNHSRDPTDPSPSGKQRAEFLTQAKNTSREYLNDADRNAGHDENNYQYDNSSLTNRRKRD